MIKVNLLQLINFLNNIYEHKKTANPNGLAVFLFVNIIKRIVYQCFLCRIPLLYYV